VIVNLQRAAQLSGRQLVVVSGGCPKGADAFAKEVAVMLGITYVEHPVLRAGDPPIRDRNDFSERAYARNRLIVEDSDHVVALVHADRTGGTENTVGHAHELRKPVHLVDDAGTVYLDRGAEGKAD
jgi:hypothetical protein